MQKQVGEALNHIEAALKSFPEHGQLLVAVSGGPDSLALLHFLIEIYSPDKLVAAHLNHGLRDSAGEEANYVAETSARWGVQCHVEQLDVAGMANQLGLTIEEAGREARYRTFARIAAEIGAAATAVGHHADDQAETILMHLLRGSGLAGLRGMGLVSPMPGAPGQLLVRPLLKVTREEIEHYCRAHGLDPLHDRSNEDVEFHRNRLRHELLPLLSRYNPQFRRGLQQTSEIVSADYEQLQSIVDSIWQDVQAGEGEGWLTLHRATWREQSLSMRRELLRRAVLQLRPDLRDVSYRPIEQGRKMAESGAGGKMISLPGGMTLHVDYDKLIVASRPSAIPAGGPQLDDDAILKLPVPGQVRLNGTWRLEATLVEGEVAERLAAHRDEWRALVSIGDERLHIRCRHKGERFQPFGLEGHSSSVKKLMINRKIPSRLRDRWPIVAIEEHLIWIVGHKIDERVRVTSESRPVVQLRCFRRPERSDERYYAR